MLKWLAVILTFIFVTLKLLGELAWPWIWVLSPAWGFILLSFLLFVGYLIIMGIVWR